MSDQERGKEMVEEIILEQVLDSFPIVTERTLTDEWDGEANQVEGSPDFIIGLDGKPLGIELTEIRGVEDARDYVDEAYRLASKKDESYRRRGIFRFPIALILYSKVPPICEIEGRLEWIICQEDFEQLGFSEIWAIDFSDAYYRPGQPLGGADMFCFKPEELFGFHGIGPAGRKPCG
jgi:hypothetical protein